MRILFAGESWTIYSTHIKGFDMFYTSEYAEGATHFIELLEENGHQVTYVPGQDVPGRYPDSAAELGAFDLIIISDIGSNTFLLTPDTFTRSQIRPNLLAETVAAVAAGTGLLMVGGYMSFTGIDAKARYGQSPLAEALPVTMSENDDRVEAPQGVVPKVQGSPEILAGLPQPWPPLLGYNRLKARDEATVLATCGEDPLIVTGSHGKGRTAAFASDLAPHWAPPEFVDWEGYGPLWLNLIDWLGG